MLLDHQVGEVDDEGLRDDAFDTLPDELEWIQIGRIRWQIDQLDATFSRTLLRFLRMMCPEIIENHDDLPFGIGRAYHVQKIAHLFFPRMVFEVNN
jgi:hypothetical protein